MGGGVSIDRPGESSSVKSQEKDEINIFDVRLSVPTEAIKTPVSPFHSINKI